MSVSRRNIVMKKMKYFDVIDAIGDHGSGRSARTGNFMAETANAK